MAFPNTVLPLHVEINVNGTWVDITSDVLGVGSAQSISIHRGTGDGMGDVEPSTCSMTIKNPNGAYSPKNINSPYYPYLQKNTPIRVYITPGWTSGTAMDEADTFARTVSAGWGTSPGGNTYTTWYNGGSFTSTDVNVSGGVGNLSVPVASASRSAHMNTQLYTDVDVYATVTPPVADVLGATIEPINIVLRWNDDTQVFYLCRMEVYVDESMALLIMRRDNVTLAVEDLTSFTYTGQALRARARIIGNEISFKVWPAASSEPDAWGVTVTDNEYVEKGKVGYRSGVASGNTNTKPLVFAWDNITVTAIMTRFCGEVTEWPLYWDESATDLRIPLVVQDIVSRINQGKRVPRSPLERFAIANGAVAYWALDDGYQADIGGSVVLGQPGYENVGPITFAQVAGPIGAPTPLPELVQDTGLGEPALTAILSADTGSTWNMDVAIRLVKPQGATSWSYTALNWTDNNDNVWTLTAFGDSGTGTYQFEVLGYTTKGTFANVLARIDPLDIVDDEWHAVRIQCTSQSGGTVSYLELYVDNTWYASDSDTVPPSRIRSISVMNSSKTYMGSASLGHITIFNTVGVVPSQISAFRGYAGESLYTRLARLATDDDVALSYITGNTTPQALTAQRTVGLSDLLADMQSADLGLMYSARNMRGIVYRELGDICGVYGTDLSYADSEIKYDSEFRPYDDTQTVWNYVTAQRYEGSKHTVTRTSGDNNTSDPPTGIGIYDRGPYTTHVDSDSHLSDIANWLLHVGAYDDLRWPMIPVWMERSQITSDQTLSAALANMDVGDVLSLTGLPTFLPMGDVECLVRGYDELLSNFEWHIAFITRSAKPYQVGLVTGDERVCAEGDMVLSSAIDADDTDLHVFSVSGTQRWCHATDDSESSSDYPMPVRLSGKFGELVTATACAYPTYDDFNRTSASSWGTADSGQVWGSSGTSYTLSTTPSYGSIKPTANDTDIRTFVVSDPGANREVRTKLRLPSLSYTSSFNMGLILRYSDTNNFYYTHIQVSTTGTATLYVDKRVGGTRTTLATFALPGTVAANVYWRIAGRVHGSSLYAKAWLDTAGEPDWQISTTDTSNTSGTYCGMFVRNNGTTVVAQADFTEFRVVSPQKLTVTRTSRGIAHAVGTDVDVDLPAYVGMEQ